MDRNPVDIIKTGRCKLSALEITEIIRAHASIQDVAVAVVGL
jgi:hypothetical protein